MEVEAVNDTVLRGRKRSAYWAYRQDLYFYAVFSKPFTYTLYTDTVQENDKQIPVCKMLLHFETAKDEQVLAKFSISSVDAEGAYPLLTIVDPQLNTEFIRSLIKKHQEGGIFPKWDCVSNYTGTMVGYHAASLVADSYVKGYRDFDVQEAYKACLRAAEYDTTGIVAPGWLIPYVMPKARYYKNTLGYIPCDRENESVAKALEYAYDDWCISVLADSLGDTETKEKYARFADAYEFYFDPATRFMRGLDSKGEWRTPFNPRSSNHRNDDYCEGTAWQWTWFVPHDIPGLVKLMGGEDAFVGKLDSLFTVSSQLEGEATSADITGLIGQYAHGNAPDGLSGNEDCGQMSAWYILNSMGFYQVCPGKPVYSIGRPLFEEVTINLPDRKTFVIRTHNNSKTNKYIESVLLNGKPLDVPFFTHNDIVRGGTMEITMSSVPTEWGKQIKN